MKQYKIPIQSLIDHIKTAMDVDPWAKEMAADLLKEQKQIVRCGDCKNYGDYNICPVFSPKHDWYCANGQRK